MEYNLTMKKKTLKNGMKVILVHKPEYVKSLFLCGFGTGGFNIREMVNGKLHTNRSGIAHFLEHQMFRYKGQDVTDLFAQMQAQTNAFTSYTETAYYFSTTADVEKPLELLLDFVQNLDIDEKSVQKEKGIILSEYSMYDQNPEMRMVRELFKSMYENHPLTIDVLGTPEDIQNMEVKDLESFYQRNYDPSKLILVGVTGKEIEPIMEHIEEYEKKYPSIENVPSYPYFAKEEPEVVRKEFELPMDVSEPYVCVGYKMRSEKDSHSCLKKDLLFSMWLDSVFSFMNPDYQSWLDQRILSSACGAEADFTTDHGYVLFYAQTNKKTEFIHLVDTLVHSLQEMEDGVFQSLKAQCIARNIRALDHFESLAIDLLRAQLENYDYFEEMKTLNSITKKDIHTCVFGESFENRTILTICPKSSNLS